ncbi:hypothetical protein WJX79_001413 [Trebouxia sp. C0005]
MAQPQRELFVIGSDQLGFANATFSWNPRGTFLAISGDKRQVHVFDRRGKLYYHITLPTPEFPHDERMSGTRALQWDASGELLAILPRGNSFAIVWTASTRDIAQSEAGFKAQEACAIAWATNQQILAVGTSKGNLVLYNLVRYQKVPIMGKHTRAVACAAWNNTEILAMGATDKQVTLTRGSDGETLNTFSVKLDPCEVLFAEKKAEPGQAKQGSCTLSVNVGKRNLYLITLDAQGQALEQPLELSFQDQYGDIERHLWFGDGYMLLGFSTGNLLVVSTHTKEIHEEVHSYKCLDCCIVDMAYCATLNKAVVAGGSSARVLDLTGAEIKDIPAEAVELPIGQAVFSAAWSPDGQLLTVSTTTGQLHTYLAALPVINSAWSCCLAYCTSLQELAVMDVLHKGSQSRIAIPTEPAFLALGPNHLAVGMNNKAWFYELQGSGGQLLAEHDYLGSVEAMQLNEHWAATIFEGRVTVHPIEDSGREESEATFQVPFPGTPGNVTCMALSAHFLIAGTAAGMLLYYHCQDKALLNEFKHTGGAIVKVFPQPYGTRVIYEDDKHAVHLYNAVNDQLLHLEEVSLGLATALWDAADPNLFLLSDGQVLYTFLYSPVSLLGAGVTLVGKQICAPGRVPLILAEGNVTFQTKSGSLETQLLASHAALRDSSNRSRDADVMKARFKAAVTLHHFKEAWDAALMLKSPQLWQALGEAYLHDLDVESAIRCYRMMGNAGMVSNLDHIQFVEDRNLLSGHILVLLGQDYDAAQELFLHSPCPTAALQMRKDLQHWPQALFLANQLDPTQIPPLACNYAQQLEMRAEYGSARAYYQQALTASDPEASQEHDICQAGVARTSLHVGDTKQGRSIALSSNNPQLCKECAQILEAQEKLPDAAELYERAGMHEKAAIIYIQGGAIGLAAPLMALITHNPKLQLEFARAKESQGEYAEAAVAYEAAGDQDAVVRLNLDKLKSPHKAASMVRKGGSREGAQRLAQYCVATRDYQAAVEFLLIARQPQQAFEVAQTHGQMDAYVRSMGVHPSSEDCIRVAAYYETRGSLDAAAQLYAQCGQSHKALTLYMQAGGDSLKKAVDLVAKEQDLALTQQLTQHLKGSQAGVAPGSALAADDASKTSTYLVLLYMALGQHEEAAEVAVGLARRAQDAGNYKMAHEQLVSSSQGLREQGRACPTELMRSLMLLHSYILVKALVRMGDHQGAARMLVRVARNITRFPKHVVPILTSTVVECQRAEMKSTAFEYAAMLMRPEYRDEINPAYKRKIEAMVRKRDKADEADEVQCECPFCGVAGPETEMDCIHCQNIIPFCIASGKRMLSTDWAECPSCHFPCRLTAFKQVIEAQNQCPMCNQEVSLNSVQLVKDPIRKSG